MATLITEHDRRAQQHKPQSREAMADAVKQLLAQGLTHRDIADALRMNVAEVIGLATAP